MDDDLDNLIADSISGVETALEGERKAWHWASGGRAVDMSGVCLRRRMCAHVYSGVELDAGRDHGEAPPRGGGHPAPARAPWRAGEEMSIALAGGPRRKDVAVLAGKLLARRKRLAAWAKLGRPVPAVAPEGRAMRGARCPSPSTCTLASCGVAP